MLKAESTTYEPSEEDILWLRRAVQAEGAPLDEVAATFVNGFMFARAKGKPSGKGTLTDYVRAYSSTVNPRWYPGGDLYQAAYDNAHSEQKTLLLERAMRRRDEFSVATTFKPSVEAAVNRALAQPPRIPNATDFAAPHVTREHPWLTLTKAEKGRNTFFARPGAGDWGGYTIASLVPVMAGDNAVIGCVLVVLLLAVVFASSRGRA